MRDGTDDPQKGSGGSSDYPTRRFVEDLRRDGPQGHPGNVTVTGENKGGVSVETRGSTGHIHNDGGPVTVKAPDSEINVRNERSFHLDSQVTITAPQGHIKVSVWNEGRSASVTARLNKEVSTSTPQEVTINNFAGKAVIAIRADKDHPVEQYQASITNHGALVSAETKGGKITVDDNLGKSVDILTGSGEVFVDNKDTANETTIFTSTGNIAVRNDRCELIVVSSIYANNSVDVNVQAETYGGHIQQVFVMEPPANVQIQINGQDKQATVTVTVGDQEPITRYISGSSDINVSLIGKELKINEQTYTV